MLACAASAGASAAGPSVSSSRGSDPTSVVRADLEEVRRDHPRDLRAVREHDLPAATRGEILAREVRADRPEVLGRRHVDEGRATPPVAESRPVRFPAPAWRETAPSTIRVAAIGDRALTVTPLGVARPICHVSAATARFAQLYAPASAARHPEPEVTPRIRPWPAAAMMRQRGAEHVEVPVEVHVEHGSPVVLGAGGEAGGAADAGDVHDRVERAEFVDELGEQGADRVGVGDRDVRRPGLTAGVDDALRGRVLGVTAPGSCRRPRRPGRR